MKRCIIELPKFRVSKPGYDVDTAALENLLFHESFLFSQPYFFQFVACPFAGVVTTAVLDQTVSVTVPNRSADPIVIVNLVASGGRNVFPVAKSEGSGNSQNGYASDSWYVRTTTISATRIDLRFLKTANVLSTPVGAYMMLMSRP